MKVKVRCALLFIIALASCQNEQQIEFARYYSSGQEVYNTHCQNCHGAGGEGLSALIPPLTDTIFLKTNRSKLACFLKNGLNKPIIISSKAFAGQMPPSSLTPIEIAQVLTYVQNSFGNKLNLHDVNEVNRDLQQCK